MEEWIAFPSMGSLVPRIPARRISFLLQTSKRATPTRQAFTRSPHLRTHHHMAPAAHQRPASRSSHIFPPSTPPERIQSTTGSHQLQFLHSNNFAPFSFPHCPRQTRQTTLLSLKPNTLHSPLCIPNFKLLTLLTIRLITVIETLLRHSKSPARASHAKNRFQPRAF